MKTPHIKISPKNGAILTYITNKRAILAQYEKNKRPLVVSAYQQVKHY